MLRFRRYRVFVVFAIISVAALYHFSTSNGWRNTGFTEPEGLKKAGERQGDSTVVQALPVLSNTQDLAVKSTPTPISKTPISKTHEPILDTATKSQEQDTSSAIIGTPSPSPLLSVTATPAVDADPNAGFGLGGKGRYEPPPALTNKDEIHWTRLPEHFPVPEASVIAIPTGKPKHIPRIQYNFRDESPSAKVGRETKLAKIKESFQHSWSGYESHAWLQDELSPVSGGSRNPFCSWAATLVDALDTLWIMGMEEEFRVAVAAVGSIDFTTTPRKDIPIFETTIRYLGGLLAAYDVSGAKHKILLDKAVELADVMMGAFDTPNRMPLSYYYWRPTFSSNPHRAGTRTVLAELGSLTMEFTHLAQLTKNARYYDAVARITNELEIWQNNTKLPGLWPKSVDASGCKKPNYLPFDQVPLGAKSLGTETGKDLTDDEPSDAGSSAIISKNAASLKSDEGTASERLASGAGIKQSDGTSEALGTAKKESSPKGKRQLDTSSLSDSLPSQADRSPLDHIIDTNPMPENVDCEPQGLASPPDGRSESFTLGGMADSTFEYLPKMFMLLGGNVAKYQPMYEMAADAANEHLIYRPMVPDGRSLLVVGAVDVRDNPDAERKMTLKAELTHLGCFTGGMWAIGAKIFARDEDLDIAAKLTDACVWAYEATKTGIMAEGMTLIPCDDRKNCPWNQTRWYDMLDPTRESREEGEKAYEQNMKNAAVQEANRRLVNNAAVQEANSRLVNTAESQSSTTRIIADGTPTSLEKSAALSKRQADVLGNDLKAIEIELAKVEKQPAYEPPKYPTHEEYVESRIQNERLPIGIPSISSKGYILRPEAIESVFIMYRITGDETWREKGWRMFEAIENYTRAEYGHSAIGDVTDADPYKLDQMESFWLAETLKYFYLLFSPPDRISLDDYTLNTEAHPFKRPT